MPAMKMLSVEVDEKLAEAIDALVKASGLYASRSEFLKDSIRKNLQSTQEMDQGLQSIRAGLRKFGEKAVQRGWKGEEGTRDQRVQLARKYIKKN